VCLPVCTINEIQQGNLHSIKYIVTIANTVALNLKHAEQTGYNHLAERELVSQLPSWEKDSRLQETVLNKI